MMYNLINYEDQLNKQVIHMDQAVCYNPEFRATKKMMDYPSRRLQIARSVFKGELEASDYNCNILYQCLLSRQGERWQNFGENPEDCTDALILSRAMMVEKGFATEITDELKNLLLENNGHLFEVTEEKTNRWLKYMKINEESSTHLFLDDATYNYGVHASREIGEFLTNKGLTFKTSIKPVFPGWEYFAHGMIEEGKVHVKKYMDELIQNGVDTIITLSGQTQYLLDTYIKKLGLNYDIRITNIVDLIDQINTEVPLYLYAGTFYTRYLRKEKSINDLVVNSYESKTKNSIEFIPILDADCRINKVTIWQKPVHAEFCSIGFKKTTMDKIVDEGIKEIEKGIQKLTVVFDPFAYNTIKGALGNSVVYFGELL